MNKNICAVVSAFFICTTFIGQVKKEKVLLKIDDQPVYQSEFVNLFGKNKSITNTEITKQSIKDDIELFIDYKLKLIEAKELSLDTAQSYIKEVARYRNQLVLPYLSDDKYIDSLVVQAYERSLKEVKASHILIKVAANSKDTLKAFNKINALRKQIIDGADFAKIAQEQSEDPSAKSNKGSLGFFSVFRMVSSFEDAAYTTKVGEVSEAFRSQFGYHILKVEDERPTMGEVEVAHIMVRDTSKAASKGTIDKVYAEVVKGGNFEELAKKYSDDRRSATNGGKMSKFSMGAMPKPFDEISFSLSEENKYSKPFATAYGWHIVKFHELHKPKNFEESKVSLKKKVKGDSRSKNISNPVVVRLKKEYTIAVNEDVKNSFAESQKANTDTLDPWIVKVQDAVFTKKDFQNYIRNRRDKKPLDVFEAFKDEKILGYYKEHLEETDKEFGNLFAEYKNGLLLFDLMKEKIWDAAQNDSIGLQEYYNEHTDDYISKELIHAVIVTSKEENNSNELAAYLAKENNLDSINNYLSAKKNILTKVGDFERDNAIFPKGTVFTANTVKTYNNKKEHVVVKILEIKEEVQQEFEDVKGKVINDYQNEIQKNWLEELRAKHKIKVYKHRLRSTKKLMENYNG
ncbi:peptidylprolyl isomerase [Flavicella sediminum]|uniref:peptidylprolyl isomerase n=1 Tax=Flavicella sediminum TaxID=2585141 RepID=UPI00111ED5FD|nr:peptidylprolyl isomerase [Flavicella sediminum]